MSTIIEDKERHDVHYQIDNDCSERGWTDMDCLLAWWLGVAVMDKVDKLAGTFPSQYCHATTKLSEQPQTTLPTEPGLWWWRNSCDWMLVHVGGEGQRLYASSLESNSFTGRPLRHWSEFGPIGEWLPCRRPA